MSHRFAEVGGEPVQTNRADHLPVLADLDSVADHAAEGVGHGVGTLGDRGLAPRKRLVRIGMQQRSRRDQVHLIDEADQSGLLAVDLQPEDQGVGDGAGRGPHGQVGRAHGRGDRALRTRAVAEDHDGAERSPGNRGGGAVVGRGLTRVEGIAPVAGGFRQGHGVIEGVLQARGGDIDGRGEAIVRGKLIVGVPGDRRGGAEHERNAVVGDIVLLLVQQADGQAGGLIDAEGQARRDPVTAVVDEIAPGDAGRLSHGVQANSRVVAQRNVDVDRRPLLVVGSGGKGRVHIAEQLRGLAHLVDHAAGRPAAEQGGGRALVDLQHVQIEAVARIEAGVAQAIQEVVVAGRKAAQVDLVAVGAALARVEGDARDVLQGVLKVVHRLLFHDLLGNDVDGLRRVAQLLGQDRQAGLAGDHHRLHPVPIRRGVRGMGSGRSQSDSRGQSQGGDLNGAAHHRPTYRSPHSPLLRMRMRFTRN